MITSSTAGLKGIAEHRLHYTAAKHGVVGLMRTLANEFARTVIRVNIVHPTGVDTPMVVNDLDDLGGCSTRTTPPRPARARRRSSSRRTCCPSSARAAVDISNAVAVLVSDDARYVTGVTLPVDAGYTVK